MSEDKKSYWEQYKIQITLCVVVAIFLLGLFIGYENGNTDTGKQDIEKAKLQEKIEQYQRDLVRELIKSDSVRVKYITVLDEIAILKKKPPIIVKQYEKIIGDVVALPTDGKIEFLSGKLSSKGSN